MATLCASSRTWRVCLNSGLSAMRLYAARSLVMSRLSSAIVFFIVVSLSKLPHDIVHAIVYSLPALPRRHVPRPKCRHRHQHRVVNDVQDVGYGLAVHAHEFIYRPPAVWLNAGSPRLIASQASRAADGDSGVGSGVVFGCANGRVHYSTC